MIPNKPFFSIVIPSYNRAKVLRSAIESVVQQNFTNWECLIIDDGSTDSTETLVSEMQNLDKRIKYFYQNNQERSAARNNGISKSKGDFICFLDSDDTYDVDFLKELELKINETNADLLISSVEVNSAEASILNESRQENFSLNYFFSTSIVPGRCCIRKQSLAKVNFTPGINISEDTLFLCDVRATNPNISAAPKAILKYNEHDDNSVNYKKFNAYSERYETLQFILKKDYASQLDSKLVRETLSNCFFGIFKYYYYNHKTFRARITMIKAILLFPLSRTKEKLHLLIFAHRKNLFS